MINTGFLLGAPYHFSDQIMIYPPKVIEVVAAPHYNQWLILLTTSQEEVEDSLADQIGPGERFPSPFEVLLNNCYHSEEYRKLAEEAFYFFTHLEPTFLYEQKMVLLGDLSEMVALAETTADLVSITEENFFDFQNKIREACGQNPIEEPIENEDPRIKRMKAKARYRDRIKAKKGMGIRLDTIIASICCMNMGINPLNIGEMSYAAVDKLVKTYQEKEKYEADIRSLQAGADANKIDLKYWIRNLD